MIEYVKEVENVNSESKNKNSIKHFFIMIKKNKLKITYTFYLNIMFFEPHGRKC